MAKFTYDLFTDHNTVTIFELKDNRLNKIYESSFLLGTMETNEIKYPTRQQMHSKRYYVTRNHVHICTLVDTNLQNAKKNAYMILERISKPYQLYEATV
jgi:hypothetical protein